MSKRTLTTLLTAIALSAAAALSVPTATLVAAPSSRSRQPSTGESRRSNKLYIVRLAESPVTAYKGGIKGYAATKPSQGPEDRPRLVEGHQLHGLPRRRVTTRCSPRSAAARRCYSYGYVFNGFAAELTEAQAAKLAAMKGVLSVEKDELMQLRHVHHAGFPRA